MADVSKDPAAGRATEPADVDVTNGDVTTEKVGAASGGASGGAESKEGGEGAEGSAAPPEMTTHREMYRFSDGIDTLLLVIGVIGGIAGGLVMPLFSIVFGELIDSFDPRNALDFMGLIEKFSLYITLVGVGAWVVSWMEMTAFMISAERQVKVARQAYYRSVLRQDVAWFDGQEATELVTKISQDAKDFKEGLGEKAGMFVRFESMFLAGFVIGFVYGWELTLVLLAMVPALAISGAAMMHFMSFLKNTSQKAYAVAGGVAEEHISAIRTVQMFGGEDRVAETYHRHIMIGSKAGAKKGAITGCGAGITMLIMFGCYALAFWFGSKLIADDRVEVLDKMTNEGCPVPLPYDVAQVCYPGYAAENDKAAECGHLCTTELIPCVLGETCETGGTIVMVFFAVIMGAFAIGQAQPSMTAFVSGRTAAKKVFDVVDRKPLIDASKTDGLAPAEGTVNGKITFTGVEFTYPTRPDAPVLQGLDVEFEAGKTTALVGASGCGKSTVIQLLERFYDPDAGSITLDGVELRDLNIKWLRRQMGLVSQEPVVFATSIADNIRFGHPDPDSVTDEMVEKAARDANAHEFISEFPKGYHTYVGEGGSSLSGGQKQRIAIARAILRNPSILLLDEATSALDNESEKVVQEALDRLVKGQKRTTIVIAHRLTTVRDADKLVVVAFGKVVEQGSHDELMAANGAYAALVRAQEQGLDAVDEEDAVAEALGVPAEERERTRSRSRSRTLSKGAAAMAGSPVARERTLSGSSADRRDSRSRTMSLAGFNKDGDDNDEMEDPMADMDVEVSVMRLLRLNASEWPYLLLGLTGAIINGLQMPAFALIFAEMISIFFLTDVQEMRDEGVFWALMFIALAVSAFLASIWQMYGFEVAGDRLVAKLRDLTFRSLIHQDIAFFDRKKNSTGAITTRLSDEAMLVRGLAGDRFALLVQNGITMIAGLAIALEADVRLTLVVLAATPIIAGAGAIQMVVFTGAERSGEKALESAGHVVAESVAGIRTVQSFGLEDRLASMYADRLAAPFQTAKKQAHIAGIGFGFSQFAMMGAYGLAFYVGGLWVNDGDLTFNRLMKVLMSLMFAAMASGQNSAMFPDAAKARKAATELFRIIDYVPPINSASAEGAKLPSIRGDIKVSDVHFTYPTRKSVKVLNGFSLDIKAGQTVALVGRSGCGKSTIVSLLMQLYRPSSGTITLDDVPITDLNVKWLRSQIGIVSQEPTLIGGRGATGSTIRDAIAYGAPQDAPVLDEAIVAAAKAANAHDFITRFPKGYDTIIGAGGTQLSGGQKQRIAIARAILRNPSILLLDEATSALDPEAERVVQEALDHLMETTKRTTIVIAHRLSTIVNADQICVVDKGVIVEQGTHEELLARRGAYFDQWEARNSDAAH